MLRGVWLCGACRLSGSAHAEEEDAHSREVEALAQGDDVGGDDAEVLGDQGQAGAGVEPRARARKSLGPGPLRQRPTSAVGSSTGISQ